MLTPASTNQIDVLEFKEKELSGSMLIIAFPTIGLISSIAGQYLIDALQLEEIGTILSPEFAPAAVIHDGHPSPPVRIYASDRECNMLGHCEQIVLIISEFMPSPDIMHPLASTIFGWAQKKNIGKIVTLEGTTTPEPKDDEDFNVYGIGATPAMKDLLKKTKIDETQEGMISGVSGILLYQAVIKKQDVLCLLSEGHTEYPDSRAAANLIKKLDVLLPETPIDAKPLFEQADRIEKKIRMYLEQAKITGPTPQTNMYG